jgi:hypothetical protein
MRKLRSWNYKAGYVVKEQLCDPAMCGGEEFIMKSAYTPEGNYIGNPRDAYRLCKKRGIKPEKADPGHGICSIGFCEKDQKWYGWSHRAIYGFGIGDTVQEGDCCASSGWTDEWLKDHPEDDKGLPVGFTARTLDDAKRMAIAFADSVS